MEVVLEDNGLKEFVEQEFLSQQLLMHRTWPSGRSVWRRQGG
jgi:hypothetical protein